MRGTMWLMALGCGILLSSSGCCGFLGNGGYGRGCCCDNCGGCQSDCGPTCGPIRRALAQPAPADDCGGCASCGTGHSLAGPGCGNCNSRGDCCSPCGDCCQNNFCFHPLRWLGNWFCSNTWCGPCCGGCGCCGEAPDCCEPCNRNGQWVGRGGCAGCNHGAGYDGGDPQTGAPLPGTDGAPLQDDPSGQPTPAPAPPAKASQRAAANYQR